MVIRVGGILWLIEIVVVVSHGPRGVARKIDDGILTATVQHRFFGDKATACCTSVSVTILSIAATSVANVIVAVVVVVVIVVGGVIVVIAVTNAAAGTRIGHRHLHTAVHVCHPLCDAAKRQVRVTHWAPHAIGGLTKQQITSAHCLLLLTQWAFVALAGF
jgi:hypothetical protein